MQPSAAVLRRAWRIVFFPASEWDATGAECRPWNAVLFGYALPLAFLPAAGWALGSALSGKAAEFSLGKMILSATGTVALSVLSVALLAFAFYLISPMYRLERRWNRAVEVAAYGSTPVLLAGVLMVLPVLVMVSVVAMLHSFFLYYLGVQKLLGCRRSEAAEFLAVACLLTAIASLGLGAGGGALGVL